MQKIEFIRIRVDQIVELEHNTRAAVAALIEELRTVLDAVGGSTPESIRNEAFELVERYDRAKLIVSRGEKEIEEPPPVLPEEPTP